jgi:hypothetical protein
MAKERLEPIGVEAIAKGVDSFLKDMRAMESAYNQTQKAAAGFAAGSGKAGSATSSLASALGGASSPLNALSGGFGSLVKAGAGVGIGMAAVNIALAAVSAAAMAAVSAIKAVTSAIVSLVTEGMQLAGTFQEMEFAALAVGRSMGLERSQIDGAIKEINDLGIRYDVAAKTVAQFARNQIDLAQAQDLVRIAQGSAILIGEDSSATMERLTWAVTTQNTMMLRRMGIMTDLQAAEQRYADSIGVEKDALTNAQKVQSAVNEIIASGASLLDVYDAAMESPTKRLRSFTGRILPEFKAAIGAPFLDAWSTVIKAVSSFVEALHGALTEGGSLYPIMINLGAAASLLADVFASALGSISEMVTNFSGDISGVLQYISYAFGLLPGLVFNHIKDMRAEADGQMNSMVTDMADWGFSIIASFAEGMARAIEAVVVPAINALSNLLTSWFAPGSPPRILPEIDAWGTATIDEWVNGMTSADFGALSKIQGILKKVVGPDTFKAASAMAMKALAGDQGAIGALTKGLEAGISDKLSDYADEVTRLVQLEIQLAQAEEQAAAAAQHLDATQNKLAAQASEYNKLLREGAPEDVLKAKRAQIKATEDELALAQEQNAQAATNIDALKDETALQEDRVDAILSLYEEQKKAAKAAKTGAAPGVKAPKPEKALKDMAETFKAGTWEITSGISDAIDKAKAALKEKLAGLWQDLKQQFEDAIAPLTTVINEKLGPAWENLKTTFDTYVLPALQDAWDWLKDKVGVATEALATLWETRLQPALQSVASFIGGSVVPLLLSFGRVVSSVVGLAVRVFAGLWKNQVLPALRDVWSFIKEKLQPVLEDVASFISEKFNGALEFLSGIFLPKTEEGMGGVKGALADVTEFFNGLATSINNITLPAWLEPGSPTPFEVGLLGIANALSVVIPAALTLFSEMALTAIEQIRLAVVALDTALTDIYRLTLVNLQTTTTDTATLIVSSIAGTFPTIQALTDMLNAVATALGGIETAATSAADAMAEGFKRAADKIGDKLLPKLEDTVKWLEKVEAAAKRAADATRGLGGAAGGAGAPGFQHGADFTVPGGFPHDSFPIRVSSGEHVTVTPKGQSGPQRVYNYNFNQTVNTGASPGGVIRQFEVMRALVG